MRRRSVVLSTLAVAVLLLVGSWAGRRIYVYWARERYDRDRYWQIKDAIHADSTNFIGRRLDEVSEKLGLEAVRWDEGYSNWGHGLGEERVYHFRGFSLWISLEILPEGMTPNGDHSGLSIDGETIKKLKCSGVRWVWGFTPSVHIDYLDDPNERMKQYGKLFQR